MQLKPITAIIVLFLVLASLLVAGCNTPNTPAVTPTAQEAHATVSPGSLRADNLAGAIDDKYKLGGYTVNTPFEVTKSGETITYIGVVTDGPKVLTPYKHDVTVVLMPSRDNAKTAYLTAIDEQKARGYQENYNSTSSGSEVYWTGYLGTTSSSNPATPKVTVTLKEPYHWGLYLPASSGNFILSTISVKDYYQLMTNQKTLAA